MNEWARARQVKPEGSMPEEWTDTYIESSAQYAAEYFCSSFVLDGEAPWTVEVEFRGELSIWIVEKKQEWVCKARKKLCPTKKV